MPEYSWAAPMDNGETENRFRFAVLAASTGGGMRRLTDYRSSDNTPFGSAFA
jgi:hypothetical protein